MQKSTLTVLLGLYLTGAAHAQSGSDVGGSAAYFAPDAGSEQWSEYESYERVLRGVPIKGAKQWVEKARPIKVRAARDTQATLEK